MVDPGIFTITMTITEISMSAFDYLVAQINTSKIDHDQIGYKIGYKLVEKIARKERLVEDLEIIKFICKDFWMVLFQKQVDNLKTNHRVFEFN